jgi:hypothetical protein
VIIQDANMYVSESEEHMLKQSGSEGARGDSERTKRKKKSGISEDEFSGSTVVSVHTDPTGNHHPRMSAFSIGNEDEKGSSGISDEH